MDRPSPDELLKHAGFLRALAFRLVGDDARADDLVQDAYVAALERPPRGALRAWLGVVLRNLAVKLRRSEGRRGRRELAAARPEPLPPADDVAARIALHRSLVQAVEALDEPYRTTIVLRFFYDLKPADVAARVGAPVETVRTRTRRALELLRGRIDRGALLLALLPLPNAKAPALTWGILMATKRRVVFALVLLLLATGSMVAYVARDAGTAPRATEFGGRRGQAPAAADAGDAAAASRAGDAAEPDEVVRGFVLLDGLPVAGASVEVREAPPPGAIYDWTTGTFRRLTRPPPRALGEATTDPQGGFTVRPEHRAAFAVDVVAAGAVPRRVLAYTPVSEPLTIRLRRGAGVLGQVVDEAGAPVPGATVRWWRWAGGDMTGQTATDADGGFRVPGDRVWVLVTAPGYAPTTADADEAARIVLRRGGRVTGVVRDASGVPVAEATVLLVSGSTPAEARTGADGRYEARLGESHLTNAAVFAPGRPPFGSWTEELALPPLPVSSGRDLVFDITLPAAVRLRGTVVEGDTPVKGATVHLYRLTSRRPVAFRDVVSDEQGAFAFEAVPAGAYEVRAATRTLGGKAAVQVPDAEPAPVIVVVAPCGRVEGVVVGGVPVRQVNLNGGAGATFLDSVLLQADVDALGRFIFEQVEPGEGMRVVGGPPTVKTEAFAVRPGETTRVTLDTSSTKTLRGRVVGADGRPLKGALVAVFAEPVDRAVDLSSVREFAVTTGADGRFASPVPSAAFVVVAHHADAAPARVEQPDPDAELEIALQPGATVSGRVVWPGGAPARDVEVRAVDPEPEDDVIADRWWHRSSTGQFELHTLGAGMVRIEARHDDGVGVPVLVEAGARDVVVELRKAFSIRGAVIDGTGRPVSAAQVTARARGKRDVVAHSTQQGRFEIRGLDDGAYDLHLEPGTQSDWHPPKLMPFLPIDVPGIAAGTVDVVVKVDTGREVAGVVLGPDGTPVARAFVAALGRGGRLPPTARTAADGGFHLAGLAPEHEEILVVAKGLPPRAVPLREAAEIRLQDGECLRFRVLAPDGTPVQRQWVSVEAVTPSIVEQAKDWVERLGKAQGVGPLGGGGANTDADGRVVIRGLVPGEYRVYPLKAAGGIAAPGSARTGDAERTVHLEAACTISGTVVDPAGNAVGSVEGKMWICVAAYRGETQLGFTTADKDGSFAMDGLPSGPLRLVVDYSGVVPGYRGEAAAEAPARDVRIVATPQE